MAPFVKSAHIYDIINVGKTLILLLARKQIGRPIGDSYYASNTYISGEK